MQPENPLADTFKNQIKDAEKHLAVLEKFPDLKKTTDRWSKVRYASPSANSLCDDADVHATCGCCDDAPILARPFLTCEGLKIYADAQIYIGEKCRYTRCKHPDWQERLQKANIGEAAIEAVRAQIDSWPNVHEYNPWDYDEDDD